MTDASPSREAGSEWLEVVRANIRGLKLGLVRFFAHDGRVTQVERTEKTRLAVDRAGADAAR